MTHIFTVIVIGAVSFVLMTLQDLTSVDAIRFYTVCVVTFNTILMIRHQRHIKKEIEPKVDEVNSKLGDRRSTDHTPWDGIDRRDHSN